MDIKTITRTASVIYADEMDIKKTETIRRKFIEAVFVDGENKTMTIDGIISTIQTKLGLTFLDCEIVKILNDPNYFVETIGMSFDDTRYNLTGKRYKTLSLRSNDNIQNIIKNYIAASKQDCAISSNEFGELINRYLYSFINTNLSAYESVLSPGKQQINVDYCGFTDGEITVINGFLNWDNNEKNKALFKLVSYCVEYAIVVNNSSESILTEAIKNKVFYLDNAILYRALGINGESRKHKILSFLLKCKQSGQKFVVSKFTKKEFTDSVNYHINQLNSTTPFGNINPDTFREYSNGEGIYLFYHDWRSSRISYAFDMFRAHIECLYQNLLKQFNIEEDYKMPFKENDEIQQIDTYKSEIQAVKKASRDYPDLIDACNMYLIEYLRGNNNINIKDTKYYFVTSDQKLIQWDVSRNNNQPITLLPSQWMGLLLKYVSRSDDDYKSFVSFLNIPHNDNVISQEDLQIIMAATSEITEDYKRQESVLRKMVEIKFDGIINGETRENAKEFVKEQLEQELESKLKEQEQRQFSQQKLNEESEKRIKYEAECLIKESIKAGKKEKLLLCDRQISDMEKRKQNADLKVVRYENNIKGVVWITFSLSILFWIGLIIWFWDIMPRWIHIGSILVAFPYCYALIEGRKFSINTYIRIMTNKRKIKLYKDYSIDEFEIKDLCDMRDMLRSELGIK